MVPNEPKSPKHNMSFFCFINFGGGWVGSDPNMDISIFLGLFLTLPLARIKALTMTRLEMMAMQRKRQNCRWGEVHSFNFYTSVFLNICLQCRQKSLGFSLIGPKLCWYLYFFKCSSKPRIGIGVGFHYLKLWFFRTW